MRTQNYQFKAQATLPTFTRLIFTRYYVAEAKKFYELTTWCKSVFGKQGKDWKIIEGPIQHVAAFGMIFSKETYRARVRYVQFKNRPSYIMYKLAFKNRESE